MKSIFFLPVYDQIDELPLVISELKAEPLPCDELLFVNNGSTDGSAELVRSSGFPHIDLPKNKGVGHSFMVAAQYAIDNGFELFGSMASNGKMLPSEMHRVLTPLQNNEADYVTGSRFLEGGDSPNLPLFRRLAIPSVSVAVNFLYAIALTDATCGYRAFRLDILKRALFDWKAEWLNTYGFEYYLYGKVVLEPSLRWMEVPITMRYPTKGKRYSKIKPFSGWFELLKPWVIARFDGKGFAKQAL